MTVENKIKGEKFKFVCNLILNKMTVEVKRYSQENIIVGTLSDDFKYITLQQPIFAYITGFQDVAITKIRLNKRQIEEAKVYNLKVK